MAANADIPNEYELTQHLLDNALEKRDAAGAGQSRQFWSTRVLQLRADLAAMEATGARCVNP